MKGTTAPTKFIATVRTEVDGRRLTGDEHHRDKAHQLCDDIRRDHEVTVTVEKLQEIIYLS